MERRFQVLANHNPTYKYLTMKEISDVAFSGGTAPKKYIVEKLAEWCLHLHELTVVCVDTNTESVYDWIVVKRMNYDFLLDPHGDTFIGDLMELSLSHNIIILRNSKDAFSLEFVVYLEESKDGTTNIDADVIEAFQKAIGRQFQS